jgi:HEAT repeat protein
VNFDETHRKVVEDLRSPLGDPRSSACKEIERWSPVQALPVLVSALSDPDEGVRTAATLCLSTFVQEDAAFDAVRGVAARAAEDFGVRREAIAALGDFGPRARSPLETLADDAGVERALRVEARAVLSRLDSPA